jgi:hypothetical protein
MAGFTRIALAFFLAAVQLPAAFALDDAPATISQELVPFSSDEGLTRLARSTAKVDFPDLANQFEAESNGAFCGPTSAAIVLNAVRGRSADLPRDRSRLRPEDLQYIPSAYDPTLPRFTQDNVITKGQKTRAQVLGEPVTTLPGWSRGPQRDAGLTTLASFFAAKSQQNPRGVIFSDAELSEIVVVVNVFRRTEGVRFGDPQLLERCVCSSPFCAAKSRHKLFGPK